MIRNTAGQTIGAQMVSAADGSAFTGAVTVYITGDAGTQAIGSVGAGLCTHEGNGYHTYRPAQAETNYSLIAFTFVGAGAIPQTIQIQTVTPAQQSALVASSAAGVVTVRDILRDALQERGVLAAGESLPSAEAEYVLGKLHRLLDNWNAERSAVYADVFSEHTLTPSLSPHTIGSTGGTFTVTHRPVEIKAANLKYAGSDVRVPIVVRDLDWYNGLSTPELESTPTDLYYEANWPLGKLWLYPVPNAAHTLELLTRVVLSKPGINEAFSLPPGGQDAITLTLAESLTGGYGSIPVPDGLPVFAREARARYFRTNEHAPRISTSAAGMPNHAGRRFDYRTGR